MEQNISNCKTENLYQTGNDLVQQLEKVLYKVKQKIANSEDIESEKEQEEQDLNVVEQQQHQNNANNIELDQTVFRCTQVYMEPSEIGLKIKLNTWIAENGVLIIRPSLVAQEASALGGTSFDPNNCILAQDFKGNQNCCQQGDILPAQLPAKHLDRAKDSVESERSRRDRHAGAPCVEGHRRHCQQQTNNHHRFSEHLAAVEAPLEHWNTIGKESSSDTFRNSDKYSQQPRSQGHRRHRGSQIHDRANCQK